MEVAEGVGLLVAVSDGVLDGLGVALFVGVDDNVFVAVLDGVELDVPVGLLVAVDVGVPDEVFDEVAVGVLDMAGVLVGGAGVAVGAEGWVGLLLLEQPAKRARAPRAKRRPKLAKDLMDFIGRILFPARE